MAERQEQAIRLIVGLGNPGPRYRRNRHNLGFLVLDELARRRGLAFRREHPDYAQAGDPAAAGGLILLKPLTYMNRSAVALKSWAAGTGLPLTGEGAARLLIVCDDLSLPLGSVRFRAGGQDGGQKGLASILAFLGTEEVARLRLGIASGPPLLDPALWADFVLADFTDPELAVVTELLPYAAAALDFWCSQGLTAAASRFNRRLPEGEESPDPDAPPGPD